MTRVTQYFNLGTTQGGVDFVDVNVEGDVPVYIDPTAIRIQSGEWAESCVEALQSFFRRLLVAIRADDSAALNRLIVPLREPNETHLGNSRGKASGRGLGSQKKAEELIQSLRNSPAVKSGFLRDLEDSALMVDGIDRDIISDITTCVIRRELIDYTQRQCAFHGIPTELQESGPMWDVANESWEVADVMLPRAGGDKLLLVPRSIVRVRLSTDKGKYYRGYLRPYFEAEVLANPKASLVRVLKDDRVVVDKGALDEELGTSKLEIISNTERYPEALDDYRATAAERARPPLSDQELHEVIGTEVANLREMLEEIRAVAPGKAGATPYHHAVAKFLSALFAQALGNMRLEEKLHDGLKRMDVTYDNVAAGGFFRWLSLHSVPCATVVVECKNYGKDVANPEFDQLAMRFSPKRGRVGILACRGFANKERALQRARAVARDDNGFILLLDDGDLEALVDAVEEAGQDLEARLNFPLLRERYGALIT